MDRAQGQDRPVGAHGLRAALSLRLVRLQLLAAGCLLVALVGFFLALNRGSTSENVAQARATVGRPAPGFSTRDLDGRPVRLGDFRGHPLLLNFWATWCTACQDEMPAIQASLSHHRAQGLQVLAVDYREQDTAAMRRYLLGLHVQFRGALDPDGRIAEAYDVSIGLPVSVFVDAKGIVRAVHIGAMDGATIEKELGKVLT